MPKIITYKAAPIHKDQRIPDLLIIAETEMKEPGKVGCQNDFQLWRHQLDNEGQKIVNALFASLPGGVLDAVLYHMLKRKTSLFRVAFDTPLPDKEENNE